MNSRNRAGRWYCCPFKVEVRAAEAFAIVDHVREHFTQEQSRRLRQEVADNAKVMRRATPAIHSTLIADVSAAGEAHIEAISTVLRESGYDTSLYEFNTALDACLTDTGPARRYERGKPAFGKGSTPR